ncbi:5'-deoxynucleotidase [Paenibacillus sp. CC-CFT747]|nr:5'-deoxynucleotidase [Paenibacillus sp. CC-CFT747]
MDHHFFAYMYRLRYIKRWSLMRNVVEENVAEHSYHVALLAHVLCTIGNDLFGRKLDADKAVTLALFHDATEVFTGDIPTPVKHQNPTILSSFRGIEQLAAERLLAMVPESLKESYRPLLGSKSSPDGELQKLVKAADLLDAYLKCVTELSAGNREFAVAKGQIEQALKKLNLEEVRYFLEHLAPSLEKTLDELAE